MFPKWRPYGPIAISIAIFALPWPTGKAEPARPLFKSGATPLLRSQAFFERNDGQVDKRVLYRSHGLGYTVFLTRDAATLVAPALAPVGHRSRRTSDTVVRLSMIGADPNTEVMGTEELPGKFNYLVGDSSKKWHTNVPLYQGVRFKHLYPGVDLTYYEKYGQLESDFIVAPGSDPGQISLRVTAPSVTQLSSSGDLHLTMSYGSFELRKPKAFQSIDGRQREVAIAYRLRNDRLSFQMGEYDPSRELIIDPVVVYATFLGGSEGNPEIGMDQSYPNNGASVRAFAVDAAGNVYVSGDSNDTDFPVTQGALNEAPQNQEEGTFISKIDPTGTKLIYSSILSSFRVTGIAFDSSGNVYATGYGGPSFTTTPGAFQSAPPNGIGPIVFKLDPTGSALVYATFVAGSGQGDTANSIAIDGAGNAYVAGYTNSNDFPLKNPLQSTLKGGWDGFISKLNPTGTALVYSTYLGGSGDDTFSSIAVDTSGNAYVTGSTSSPDFPTVAAFQSSYTATQGTADAVVAKLNAAGSALLYSTYLGSGGDVATAIVTDAAGDAFVTGTAWYPFPVQQALQPTCSNSPNGDGFVTKFSPTGALDFSTCLEGGSEGAEPFSIVLDSSGNIYVAGVTSSTDFPLVNAIQSNGPGLFLTEINSSDSSLIFSSYVAPFPTSWFNTTYVGVGVDVTGNIYVAGTAGQGFPEVNALQPAFGGSGQLPPGSQQLVPLAAFVMKISPGNAPALGVATEQLGFLDQLWGSTSSPESITLTDLGSAPLSISNIATTGDFQETNNCLSGIAAGGTCTMNVTFTPTALGSRAGTITITDNAAGSPQTIVLQGNAVVPVLTPSNLSFPNQTVGTSSPAQTVTLTNSGQPDLVIGRINMTGDFSETNNCGSNVAAGGGNCSIAVVFTPTTTSPENGTLTVSDSAANSPQTVSLSGNVSMGLTTPSGSSPSATVAAGGTASYTLAIGGGGFAGTASLSCTGAPTGASCSVPATESVSATTPTNFTVSVSTTSRTVSSFRPFKDLNGSPLWAVIILGVIIQPVWGHRRRAVRKIFWVVPLLFLLLCSCGGGNGAGPNPNPSPSPNPNGTPAGTYTLMVTATSGSMIQSVVLTLNVQ
jgi:hypothetical protein